MQPHCKKKTSHFIWIWICTTAGFNHLHVQVLKKVFQMKRLWKNFLQCKVKVFTGGGSIKTAAQCVSPSLPYTADCICTIGIRVSGCLVLPCLWFRAFIIIIRWSLSQNYIYFFLSLIFQMLASFAASPFDKLLGRRVCNRSQLMLFCVSLHANVSATPLASQRRRRRVTMEF